MKTEIENILETSVSEFRPSEYDVMKSGQVSKHIEKIANSKDINDYLQIMSIYLKHKQRDGLSICQIARKAETPELTVRRFENLKSFPNILTLIKILRAVGLKIVIAPIDRSNEIEA